MSNTSIRNSISGNNQSFPINNTRNLNPLASGESVIDRKNSHLANDTETLAAVNAALARIHSGRRDFIEAEITFTQPVGFTKCVSTTVQDNILIARRKNRNGNSRIVLDRESELCFKVFVVLKKSGPSDYVLITGFIGAKPHPELFDEAAFNRKADPKKAFDEAVEFWNTHALIVPWEEIDLESNFHCHINNFDFLNEVEDE